MCIVCTPVPTTPHCSDRETLKIRLQADIRVYRDAASAVQADRTSEKANALLEHSRLAYDESRKRFMAHIESHGCG
jgi:hypothetical protein